VAREYSVGLLLSRRPDRDASVRSGCNNAPISQVGDGIHGAIVMAQHLLGGIQRK
jgi:hypothetical protein